MLPVLLKINLLHTLGCSALLKLAILAHADGGPDQAKQCRKVLKIFFQGPWFIATQQCWGSMCTAREVRRHGQLALRCLPHSQATEPSVALGGREDRPRRDRARTPNAEPLLLFLKNIAQLVLATCLAPSYSTLQGTLQGISQSVSHSLQSQHDPRTHPPLGTDTPTYAGGQWRGASLLAARMRGLWLPVPPVVHTHARPVRAPG